MGNDGVRNVVQERVVPEAMRSLSTLERFDYVDVFTATTTMAATMSPEQWARAVVEGAAGTSGQFLWRVVLGLRLEWRPSPGYVGGWKIADKGENWIRVEAASWFLTAQLVFRVTDRQLSLGTFVRYDSPIAAPVWLPISIFHRRAVPDLLRHAARRGTCV